MEYCSQAGATKTIREIKSNLVLMKRLSIMMVKHIEVIRKAFFRKDQGKGLHLLKAAITMQ
jgi:hypothetical protein